MKRKCLKIKGEAFFYRNKNQFCVCVCVCMLVPCKWWRRRIRRRPVLIKRTKRIDSLGVKGGKEKRSLKRHLLHSWLMGLLVTTYFTLEDFLFSLSFFLILSSKTCTCKLDGEFFLPSKSHVRCRDTSYKMKKDRKRRRRKILLSQWWNSTTAIVLTRNLIRFLDSICLMSFLVTPFSFYPVFFFPSSILFV